MNRPDKDESELKQFPTPGETMCQRTLEKENRGNIPHFVTGQHHAEVVADDVALFAVLTFVNVSGMAVLVLCIKKSGTAEWEPYQAMRIAGCAADLGPQKIPESFELTDLMKAALKEGEDRYVAEQEFAEEE